MKNIKDYLSEFLTKDKLLLYFKCLIGVFVLALLVGLVLFITNRKKTEVAPLTTLPSVKIAPDQLWIPEEPLPLPPIQFSREQKKVWSGEDVDSFFVAPDEDTLKLLHDKNTEKITNLLEGVE